MPHNIQKLLMSNNYVSEPDADDALSIRNEFWIYI